MTTPADLALAIADAALNQPFRQVRCCTTSEFLRWLSQAGIRLQPSAIQHLWKIGVIRPIAVSLLPDQLFGVERFLPFTHLGGWRPDEGWSIDLGSDVAEDDVTTDSMDVDHQLLANAWWHPFQVWEFDRLARILESNIALEQSLHSVEASKGLMEFLYEDIPGRVAKWANSQERKTWAQILGLLLYAEPLVHLWYSSKITYPSWGEASVGDYLDWVANEQQNAPGALARLSLSMDEAKNWHTTLRSAATLADPVARLRILLRYVDRDKRAQLRDGALRADAMYDAAEVLRRYLEEFHDVVLPEETGSLMETTDPTFNLKLYGVGRLFDFDRQGFRRIVRRFGVDPQARLTWFVEGDTEVGFAKRLAQRQGASLEHIGIDVLNFHGIGGLGSDRTRLLLDRLRNEEVFVYVTVDEDGQGGNDHIRQLKQYAKDELLIGFRIWKPDFEDANFTRSELAQIATKMINDEGILGTLTEEDIAKQQQG